MKILATDTSTGAISLALVDEYRLAAEISTDRRSTHSKNLMPLLDGLLSFAGFDLKEIDAFAVVTGPGSFTGLRIGISTIKGLAHSLDKPVAGITSFEALAYQVGPSGYPVQVILEARKKEVYYAGYLFEGLSPACTYTGVGSLESALEKTDKKRLIVGNACEDRKDEIKRLIGPLAVFAMPWQNHVRASVVAHAARDLLLSGEKGDYFSLVPEYFRPPDATIRDQKNIDKDMHIC